MKQKQDYATYQKIIEYLHSSGAPSDIIKGIEKINEEKQIDEITQIPNRKFLKTRLQEEVAKSERHKTSLSLMMVDADDFKKVNDTHGHPAGDEVLRLLAGYIENGLRTEDVIGRYGGEEFLAIFPHTSKEEAYTLAERIREDIGKQKMRITTNESEEKDINITVSIGVSELNSDTEYSIEKTLKNADKALYDAKNAGKNQVKTA